MQKKSISTWQKIEALMHTTIFLAFIINICGFLSVPKTVGNIINILMVLMIIQIVIVLLVYLRNHSYPEYWSHKAYEKYVKQEVSLEQALKYCQRAQRCEREDAFTDFVLSLLYYDNGCYNKALEHVNLYIESEQYNNCSSKRKILVTYIKGLGLYDLGNYHEAQQLAEPLIENEELGVEFFIITLHCWFEQKEYNRVLQSCNEYLQKQYEKRIQNLKVLTLYQNEDKGPLLTYLDYCITQSKNIYLNAITYADTVIEFSLVSKYHNAIEFLAQATEDQHSKKLYTLRSQLYSLIGEQHLSKEDEEIAETYPEDVIVQNNSDNELLEIGCIKSRDIIRFK